MAKGDDVIAKRKVKNGKNEEPSVLLTPIAVDKHIVESTVIADGFHSSKDVYQVVTK